MPNGLGRYAADNIRPHPAAPETFPCTAEWLPAGSNSKGKWMVALQVRELAPRSLHTALTGEAQTVYCHISQRALCTQQLPWLAFNRHVRYHVPLALRQEKG